MEEEKRFTTEDDSEDDVAVSMVDILEEEEKLQADANAVLGGSDDRNCTYLQGYVDRQALYSCRTCAGSNGEPAGVCLACSLECHEGHELIELYTKRNFRCDCGNSKFNGLACKLCPNKLQTNPDNCYNHNYRGLYCSCSRPYPDPDDSVEDVMIQCIVCEDWFHMRHITSQPVEEEFEEMICQSCMASCPFLWRYVRLCKALSGKPDSEVEVDVVGVGRTSDSSRTESSAVERSSEEASGSTTIEPASVEQSTSAGCSCDEAGRGGGEPSRAEPSSGGETSSQSSAVCRLQELDGEDCVLAKGAAFWPADWRKQLCRCAKCRDEYGQHRVDFLLDERDTIAAYEERGKAKPSKTSYQQGLEALSQLDHVQKVEVIQEYNNLKSKLNSFLQKFAENKKVVRQEDINDFFVELRERKRQKTNSSTPPYFCK